MNISFDDEDLQVLPTKHIPLIAVFCCSGNILCDYRIAEQEVITQKSGATNTVRNFFQWTSKDALQFTTQNLVDLVQIIPPNIKILSSVTMSRPSTIHQFQQQLFNHDSTIVKDDIVTFQTTVLDLYPSTFFCAHRRAIFLIDCGANNYTTNKKNSFLICCRASSCATG